jgi:hypothetical protein
VLVIVIALAKGDKEQNVANAAYVAILEIVFIAFFLI